MGKKDTDWTREELILALDLYFAIENGEVGNKSQAYSDLAEFLPKRKAGGVEAKIYNFTYLDPDNTRSGYSNTATLDRVLWNEFHDNQEELRNLAEELKAGVSRKPLANPNWTEEEIILGLETYWKVGGENLKPDHPEVIKLSNTLKGLDIFPPEQRAATFRGTEGITKVLQLYRQIEANSYNKIKPGKLAIRLYQQYDNDREALHQRAEDIRRQYSGETEQPAPVPYITEEDGYAPASAREGSVVYRRHVSYERNPALVKSKKAAYKREHGHLACEACGFDFKARYGAIGEGFIECHHLRPLSESEEERTTTHEDLALLCANCHRMIHKLEKLGPHSLEELRERLKSLS